MTPCGVVMRPTRARDYAGRVGHLTAAHAAAFAPNLEARGIDTPRIWTAERDIDMWNALQA